MFMSIYNFFVYFNTRQKHFTEVLFFTRFSKFDKFELWNIGI